MEIKQQLAALIEKAEEIIKIGKEELNKKVVKSSRFTVLNDGWILDRVLGLEWGPTSKKEMNFEDAQKYCADLGARLPSAKELFSLIDHDKYDPAIDKDIFTDTKSSWYWSGTDYKPNSGYAWCVYFYYGSVNYLGKGLHNYVRPVRASQCVLAV